MNVIITIGRQFGSGGRRIAAEIGSRLGIPVYDNALLAEAAAESGYSPDIFKKRDEKRHLFSLSRLFSSLESNAANYMSDNELFQIQSEAIRNIASKGSCIIVGRCADYVLRDFDNVFKVFVTCPYEQRLNRVMGRMGVDRATAEIITEKKEKNRARYYNYYSFGKWGDAGQYDLCIDSSLLGIEGTANLIIETARKAGFIE